MEYLPNWILCSTEDGWLTGTCSNMDKPHQAGAKEARYKRLDTVCRKQVKCTHQVKSQESSYLWGKLWLEGSRQAPGLLKMFHCFIWGLVRSSSLVGKNSVSCVLRTGHFSVGVSSFSNKNNTILRGYLFQFTPSSAWNLPKVDTQFTHNFTNKMQDTLL